MQKKNTIKLSVRVDMETYNRLCKVCKENESISEIVREYINIGLGIKTTADDIDKISEIIRNQVESVCERPLERLIKIVIKRTVLKIP
jgi:predicted CopG family antitoxin